MLALGCCSKNLENPQQNFQENCEQEDSKTPSICSEEDERYRNRFRNQLDEHKTTVFDSTDTVDEIGYNQNFIVAEDFTTWKS